MKENIFLSVVIPAYKEEARIHLILEALIAYQNTKNFLIEVLVVIDGSPDATAQTVRKYAEALPHFKMMARSENRGKGYSVKEGVLTASGKHILFADADNSTPLEQVDKLLAFANKYPVVIGSRYCDGGRMTKKQPLIRIIGSRVINRIIRILAVRGIKDTQCGFKLFERDAAQKIFARQSFERFSFDIEILAIAQHLGYSIKEVGVEWIDHPHSTVNPLKDGIRMICDAWRVRRNLKKIKTQSDT